jgi:uncharacterized protein (TIGR04255 family)
VCEFQFSAARDWDWTIPGLLYSQIKEDFPKKRQEKAIEINIATQPGNVQQSLGESLAKMQFLRDDETAMIQVGPDLLAVNVMAM